MKKTFLLIALATITSILHAADQPWQSWDSIDGNTPLSIAPYLLTYQPDEFDVADTSSLKTVRSDDYLMTTIPFNNSMCTAGDSFTPIEHLKVPSYTIDSSLSIPQRTLVYHDYTTVFSSSTTIEKAVEKLQEKHQTGIKRGMKKKTTNPRAMAIQKNDEEEINEEVGQDAAALQLTTKKFGLATTCRFNCDLCNFHTDEQSEYITHTISDNHLNKLSDANTDEENEIDEEIKKIDMILPEWKEKSHVCILCHYCASKQEDLYAHMRSQEHHDQFRMLIIYKYNCDQCNFRTDLEQFFIQHTNNKHLKKISVGENNMFLCPYCNFNALREKTMEEHELSDKHRNKAGLKRIAWDEKPYACKRCEVGFFKESGLEKHLTRISHEKYSSQ